MPTLTDRDLAILLSVGTGLVLTNREIEWLHFPGWTAREDAHVAIAPTTPYSASTSVRRRLGTLVEAGYLATIPRTLSLRRRTTTRLPHLYALTERGRAILREEQVIATDDRVCTLPPQTRAVVTIEHAALVGQCYGALAAATRSDQLQMDDWRGWLQCGTRDDPYDVTRWHQLPMLFDATVRLTLGVATRCLRVAIDSDHVDSHRWQERILAQERYGGSEESQLPFGKDVCVTLIIALSQHRLREIASMIVQTIREPRYPYLFTTIDQLHPRCIRQGWQHVSEVSNDLTVTLLPTLLWPFDTDTVHDHAPSVTRQQSENPYANHHRP